MNKKQFVGICITSFLIIQISSIGLVSAVGIVEIDSFTMGINENEYMVYRSNDYSNTNGTLNYDQTVYEKKLFNDITYHEDGVDIQVYTYTNTTNLYGEEDIKNNDNWEFASSDSDVTYNIINTTESLMNFRFAFPLEITMEDLFIGNLTQMVHYYMYGDYNITESLIDTYNNVYEYDTITYDVTDYYYYNEFINTGYYYYIFDIFGENSTESLKTNITLTLTSVMDSDNKLVFSNLNYDKYEEYEDKLDSNNNYNTYDQYKNFTELLYDSDPSIPDFIQELYYDQLMTDLEYDIIIGDKLVYIQNDTHYKERRGYGEPPSGDIPIENFQDVHMNSYSSMSSGDNFNILIPYNQFLYKDDGIVYPTGDYYAILDNGTETIMTNISLVIDYDTNTGFILEESDVLPDEFWNLNFNSFTVSIFVKHDGKVYIEENNTDYEIFIIDDIVYESNATNITYSSYGTENENPYIEDDWVINNDYEVIIDNTTISILQLYFAFPNDVDFSELMSNYMVDAYMRINDQEMEIPYNVDIPLENLYLGMINDMVLNSTEGEIGLTNYNISKNIITEEDYFVYNASLTAYVENISMGGSPLLNMTLEVSFEIEFYVNDAKVVTHSRNANTNKRMIEMDGLIVDCDYELYETNIELLKSRPMDIITLSSEGEKALNGNYNITWNDIDFAEEYSIYISTLLFVNINEVLGDPIISYVNYINGTFESATTYYIAVIASNDYGTSKMSDHLELQSLYKPSSAPVLEEINPTSTNGTIILEWNSVATASFYKIYRSNETIEDVSEMTPIGTSEIALFEDQLTEYGKYYYVVVACNEAGDSLFSNEVEVEYVKSSNNLELILIIGGSIAGVIVIGKYLAKPGIDCLRGKNNYLCPL